MGISDEIYRLTEEWLQGGDDVLPDKIATLLQTVGNGEVRDRPVEVQSGFNNVDTSIRELQLELMRQWLSNHAEHCGKEFESLPHPGSCGWPLPPVLAAMSSSEVYLLVLLASGEVIGFQL